MIGNRKYKEDSIALIIDGKVDNIELNYNK